MKIQELLTDESKWCKGAVSRTTSEVSLSADHPDAVSWCLLGAIVKCYPATTTQYQIRCRLLEHLGLTAEDTLVGFNDRASTTFNDILDLCKKVDV